MDRKIVHLGICTQSKPLRHRTFKTIQILLYYYAKILGLTGLRGSNYHPTYPTTQGAEIPGAYKRYALQYLFHRETVTCFVTLYFWGTQQKCVALCVFYVDRIRPLSPSNAIFRKVKVHVKVYTLDIAPLRSESPPQLRSSMGHVFSRDLTVLPCIPTCSSAIGMSHTCLCLPSRGWYSFTDLGGMEG